MRRLALSVAVAVVGAVITVWAGSFLVAWIVEPYAEQLESETGLREGGKLIGMAERLLIYIFILAGSPTAIGLLVTAKSILRFGEVSDTSKPKQSEYVIIGTLVSFAYAVTLSYVFRRILGILP